ncbi:MAG: hypothetical protein M3Y41_13185 [Pseudomonadota bacterium]|nr:hypothetical protein [Pseudomonadota bacterium]
MPFNTHLPAGVVVVVPPDLISGRGVAPFPLLKNHNSFERVRAVRDAVQQLLPERPQEFAKAADIGVVADHPPECQPTFCAIIAAAPRGQAFQEPTHLGHVVGRRRRSVQMWSRQRRHGVVLVARKTDMQVYVRSHGRCQACTSGGPDVNGSEFNRR